MNRWSRLNRYAYVLGASVYDCMYCMYGSNSKIKICVSVYSRT